MRTWFGKLDMTRNDKKQNPAAGAGAVENTESNPPLELFDGRLSFRRQMPLALFGLLSVVLLTICFEPFDIWWVAYVALAPWVLMLGGCRSNRRAVFWGWITGIVFWAANLYWLWWITLVGYAALVLYLSAFWLVAAIVLRAAMRRHWPVWIVLPAVWVALEYARAYGLSGFPWFYLAHSQYSRTHLIQIADVTGQYGVSFFVAMVNGAVADVLASPLFIHRPGAAGPQTLPEVSFNRQIVVGPVVCIVAAVGMLLYGQSSIVQTEKTTTPGPVIGVVQRAVPISLAEEKENPEQIFDKHYRASRKFIGAGCDLLIWPETMLPQGMNSEFLRANLSQMSEEEIRCLGWKFIGPAEKKYSVENLKRLLEIIRNGAASNEGRRLTGLKDFVRQMNQLSQQLDCPILAGGSTLHANPAPIGPDRTWITRNSAMWFENNTEDRPIYSKIHLVPFGEYVPFEHSWTWLHRRLREFVPAVMEQLAPGKKRTLFELSAGPRRWRLATPICYEGTFARECRRLVMRKGQKQADILVNISNDGWFVPPKTWPDLPMAEHPQHLVQYCFRAVENRMPVVRAVNTGISASIDSCGRIVARVKKDHAEAMVAGEVLLGGAKSEKEKNSGPQILVDERISVYSRIGDIFAQSVCVAVIVMIVVLIFKRVRESHEELNSE